ncbi:WD40 repeat domain-containing serine/threonine protein kinase [Fimbriiglobus ruber]|uniref:High-affnity carbon uptake protein Hat/HatR n=1 Tax=Fimbriiglobus ruber TaxID=1908690 RepID=A0A225DQJ8_9BACT|nr:protein kinase [Fimbriiglobus ruber]OWK40868.1 High-affnity carbon uptake protein Hat/HatR [Fimbriiglobus ruber]
MLRTCPSEAQLLAFHRGTLPAAELDAVADHLEECPTCESVAQRFDAAANSADGLLIALRRQSSISYLPPSLDTRGRPRGPNLADPENWPSVPGYEIEGVLGQGGMGVVYKARQTRLGRFVALKQLRVAGGRELARARVEAEALAQLRHPGVVQIHEFVEHEGKAFLALDLVPGGSLGAKMAGKPQQPEAAAAVVEAVARAVHFVHTRGIVHRDIKPANILLESRESRPGEFGVVKIADFGIAKQMALESGSTRDGDVLGTPNYMSPEQAAGSAAAVGPASDVYSLGAVLYEMLTARVPLQGPTTIDTLILVRTEEPVPPRQLQPGVPRDLDVICMKCLQKDPGRRYASAEHLADDLRRFLDHKPILARPTPAWERVWKAAKRHPAVAGLSAALVAVVIVGFVLVAWQWQRAAGKASDEAVAKREAQDKERQATRLSAGIALDRGITLCEANELDRGLVWLARSLDLASQLGDAPLERAVRCNLAGWGEFLSERRATFPHKDWVWAVAISPDERTVLTGSKDATARLWDARTGAPMGDPIPHNGPVWAVAFSPDGTKYLTAGGDLKDTGSAQLWDAATGRRVAGPWAHPSDVMTAAFSPDGQTVLTVCAEYARLWRIVDGSPRSTLTHPRPARHEPTLFPALCAAFSPDGTLVATAGEDGTARFWDAATGQPRGPVIRASGPILALAFSPDGKLLLTGADDGTARIWDAATGQPRGPVWQHRGKVKAVAFSPDGRFVATGGEIEAIDPMTGTRAEVGGEARLWLAATGQALGIPLPHGRQVRSLAFSPDGRLLMTGSRDAGARFFLVATGYQVGRSLGHDGTVQTVVFSRSGRFAVAASAGGNQSAAARLWTTPAATGPGRPLAFGADILGLQFHPDGRTVLAWSADKTVREQALGDPATGLVRAHPSGVVNAVYSPDGRTYVTAQFDGLVQAWDRETGRKKYEFLRWPEAVALAFSPDGRILYTGCLNGTVEAHAADTGVQAGDTWRLHMPVFHVSAHADGRTVLLGTDAGAQLWDWESHRLLRQADGNTHATVFFPGGKGVLSWVDGFLREWSMDDHPSRPTRFHPEGGIDRFSVSPDGSCVLISGDHSQPARVWDVATGKALGPAPSAPGARPVAFSPDGRRFVVGTRDGRVSVWATPVPIAGEPERIRAWVEAATGMELDPEGTIMPLAPDARAQRAGRLKQLGGSPLPVAAW